MTTTRRRAELPATAHEPGKRRPKGQAWLVVPGLLLMLPALGATALRVLPPTTERLARLASFIPYGLIFWLPSVILLGAATIRSWRHRSSGRMVLTALSALAAVGLAATLAWEGPAFVGERRATATAPVTVVSLNVARTADPAAVSGAAASADVVVFVEASHEWVSSLPAEFRQEFPNMAPAMDHFDGGAVVFSRYPVTTSTGLPTTSSQQWAAILDTPQLGPLRVVGVHPCNPFCAPGLWLREADQLRAWLAARDTTVPTVVAGDFNAVDDHITMRGLYADGFRSAANLAGVGFVRTWPANRAVPPMIGIDHVLVDDRLTATGFSTFEVPGTDHLGVRAVIAGTDG